MKLELALFGNPNSGRTSLFNELTGSGRSVGNWTGVTVALEIGHFHYQQQAFDIVDMPGIYSLFTHSPEQLTACEYLLNYHPDVIVNVVDATNLERNLYLTTQLIETGVPMVVALNMSDELNRQGLVLDLAELSRLLGVPCVRISATQRIGIEKLLDKVREVAANPRSCNHHIITTYFSAKVNQKLTQIINKLPDYAAPDHLNLRWVALQMLEEHWQGGDIPQELIGGGDDWELCIGEERYRAVADIASRVVKKSPLIKRHEFSRKLDAIVCQRVLALPIFMLVMCAIFYLSFGPVGSFIQGLFKLAFYQWLPQAAESALAAMGMGPSVTGLVIDGIIAGVGAVLVFLPQLMLLFFCLSLLEFSGYMARAAFITDKLLAGFGLSGMSFIPMVLGFGCSVPAIMSCGSLENKRERMVTMMVVPFMSCSARMPVYVLFAAAFFATHQTLVVISLYLLGVAVALLTTLVLSPRIMQGRKPVFLMEMPPYRKPVWHCVWRSLWVRTWDYISQAGTVILIASVVIWFFSNFNWHMQLTHSATSILAQLGVVMAPVFAPLGFGTWQMTVALISGFLTKEAVVSSLAVLYAGSIGIGGLGDVLGGLISPPAAYALMVFVLLYTPCVATLAAVYKGSSSWKFTAWMVVYQLAVAWLLSFVVYRIGLLLF